MKFTLLPFLVAMVIAVADMPTHVYQVCQRQIGTLKLEPWRIKAASYLRSVSEAISAFTLLMRALRGRSAMVAGAVLMALLASALGAEPIMGAGVLLAGTTEAPTLAEVKAAIENSNRLFQNDFKEVNEKIKALEAKGAAVDPILLEVREKLNKAMDAASAKNEAFIAMQAKLNRLELQGTDPKATEQRAAALARFNRELKSRAALNGRTVADVDEAAYASYTKAFDAYLRRGERGLGPDEQRAMSVGSDPDGGYTVTPDLSGKIVERIFELSPIRQFANIETIGSDALEGENETDDASGGWVAETGTRSDSANPTIGKYRIVAHELYAQPKSTQKLLEDSNRDIQAWLQKRSSNKFARLEATAFTTGNGATQPRGFASYGTAATGDSTRAWGTFEHVATGGATYGTDPNGVQKLIALIHKMNPAYLPGSAFYMNRNTLSTTRQLTDASSAGKFVFIPSFQAGMPDTLLGYPVRVLIDMVDIASNALAVAFGDMNATYTIVDRVGLSLLVDPYTDKPNVRFYMRKRVGGDAVNFESMKFLKFSA